MAKIYNNSEYRNLKRVVSFVEPIVKKAILMAAKKKKTSISKEVADALREKYGE